MANIPSLNHSGLVSNDHALKDQYAIALADALINEPGIVAEGKGNAVKAERDAQYKLKYDAKYKTEYKSAYDAKYTVLIAVTGTLPADAAKQADAHAVQVATPLAVTAGIAGAAAVNEAGIPGKINDAIVAAYWKDKGSAWNGFLDAMSGSFNSGVATLNTTLQLSLGTLQNNPTDPALLAKVQSALSEYTVYRNAQSNTAKAFKDIAASTVQNFR